VGREDAVAEKPTSIEGYLAAVAEDGRARFAELRKLVHDLAPDAVESISYDIPTFKYQGRPLIYFGVWKTHCALYGPNLAHHTADLVGYDVAKGTLRLPPDKPLPEALVRKLLTSRKEEIEAAAAARKRPPKKGAVNRSA
jgi:uncharacterized protein YdhG (YjbR/CyaY superfamily)